MINTYKYYLLIFACLLLASLGGCNSTRTTAELPDVETREDLVAGLRTLGYLVVPLAPNFFPTAPSPSAAYEVTQPDGMIFTLLAFDPEDYDQLRSNESFSAIRPKVGLIGTAQDRYRPVLGTTSAAKAQIFRKGSVVVVFPFSDSVLSYDLEQLLGAPAY